LEGGILAPVEQFGRVLELAVGALLHPVGHAALWVWHFLRGLWDRLRGRHGPDGGPPGEAAEGPSAKAAEDPSGEATDGSGPTSGASTPTASSASALAAAAEGEPAAGPAGFSWGVGIVYALVVLGWAVLTIMRRLDSALQQMEVGGKPAGSALGFSVSFGSAAESLSVGAAQKAVDATRDAWLGFATNVAQATGFRDPLDVATSLVLLDLCFIVLYTTLLAIVLRTLIRLNAPTWRPRDEDPQPERRTRVLYGASGALAVLVLVDLLEDLQLYLALVAGEPLTLLPGQIALGPLLSLLKLPLTVGVLVAVLFVAVSLAARTRPLVVALMSIRGVLYAVAVVVLMLMVGIGAAQVEDVIRAWDGWRAAWAAITCFALALTVAGVARLLSSRAREHPAPDRGRSAQPLLLGGGVLLVLAGLALQAVDGGWGVSVAGALLVGLWALGLPIDGLAHWHKLPEPLRLGPPWLVLSVAAVIGGAAGAVLAGRARWPVLPGILVGALAVLSVLAAWTLRAAGGDAHRRPQEPPAPEPEDAVDPVAVAAWGDRLGRVVGSAVAAALVVAIARATALDAYVRVDAYWEPFRGELPPAPLAGAVLAGASGLVVCAYRAGEAAGRLAGIWTRAWLPLSALALVAGVRLHLARYAVDGAQDAGSVAVLLGGFLLLSGLLAASAWAVRQGPITQYALAPALRVLRFKRFPVLLFLLAWALVVSVLDAGGYHDIRRAQAREAPEPTPTIGQAWQRYVDAGPAGAAQPVVMVGAQGGGIRAAVWTALVMECIFGPGPVADSGDVCAKGAAATDATRLADAADDPLPVFLASGASGGSVGLAAWSARRADLVQDGAASATPKTVEQALDRDFVASDIARLLLADLPHTLLAWDRADRAEMLELAWERAWYDHPRPVLDPSARGLARGLRETWDRTHADGSWATPVLALNGISVEDGCRFLASAVDFALPRELPENPADIATAVDATDDRPDDAACRGVATPPGDAVDVIPSTNELIDYLCPDEDVPLSTAAHISARFPYVSPTGRIERRPCTEGTEETREPGLVPGPAVSYDADGGMFDNAGSGTAVDTWRAMAPLAAATERATGRCMVPVFVQIDNSGGRATVSSAADPRPNELTAPVATALGQVSSREAYARSGAAAAFGLPVSAGGRQVQLDGADARGPLWFRIVLFGQPGPEPPLGWTLSEGTVKDMRSHLQATPNRQNIQRLRQILADDLGCETAATGSPSPPAVGSP
jgi:hypothetical protein